MVRTEQQLERARDRQRRYLARKRGEDVPLRPAGRSRSRGGSPALGPFARLVISRLQRQRCKVCWHDDGFDFSVPDAIWDEVVPVELRNRVVCLRCFDLLAAERKIAYQDHLAAEIYFAGEHACLELRIEWKGRCQEP